MGNCRCVSKLWSSIFRRPNYRQLFRTKFLEPPRFLFTFIGERKFFFYNSPQPQNPDDNSSLVATRHHSNSFTDFYRICRPVHGLVCHQRTGKNYIVVVISNPVTGEFVTLPKIKTKVVGARSYLEYDPIEKQFKVLCVSYSWVSCGRYKNIEYQVLTFQCSYKSLYVLSNDGICINSVLYYRAGRMMGCFDVKSERLYFISVKGSNLVNYKGKLGAVDNRNYMDFLLWVLEDPEIGKWSKHIYKKAFQWQQELKSVDVVGVTGRGEIVLCSRYVKGVPFYIFYYNLEENIVVRVRVEVPEFKGFEWPKVYISPNYVENVKLM